MRWVRGGKGGEEEEGEKNGVLRQGRLFVCWVSCMNDEVKDEGGRRGRGIGKCVDGRKDRVVFVEGHLREG
jgi:hypothetical protein